MIKKLITTLAIATLISHVSIAQNYSQSVKYFAEGKYYKNSETGRSVKYGYISSLNTYGVTFKDAEGNLSNFMNCTEQLSSDEQYMELTYCMSPNTGGTLSRISVTKSKIVLYGNDGSLTFYLENYNNSKAQNSNNYSKPSYSSVDVNAEFYKIGNLEIKNEDYGYEKLSLKQWKDAIDKNIGNNWRLPTKVELMIMYKNKKSLNFPIKRFMAQEFSYLGVDNGKLIVFGMFYGELDKFERLADSFIKVRLVRVKTNTNLKKTTVKPNVKTK
jgi:hypothetical protein